MSITFGVILFAGQQLVYAEEQESGITPWQRSNQFTQPDHAEQAELPVVNPEDHGFIKMAETEELILYVEHESLGIAIKAKQTGYVWQSGVHGNEDAQLNETWRDMANSALTVEYLDQRDTIQTESLVTYNPDIRVEQTDSGFKADVVFGRSNIELTLLVSLDGERLQLTIPEESIVEGDRAKLVTLRLYPFLGAADENLSDGYLFIPDGSGALIRFEEEARATSPYRAPVYGEDAAFERNQTAVSLLNEPLSISYPVFGVVHGEKQNGSQPYLERVSIMRRFWPIQKEHQLIFIGRLLTIHFVMSIINQLIKVVMVLIRTKLSDFYTELNKSVCSYKRIMLAMWGWPMRIKNT